MYTIISLPQPTQDETADGWLFSSSFLELVCRRFNALQERKNDSEPVKLTAEDIQIMLVAVQDAMWFEKEGEIIRLVLPPSQ